jgi:hypothetical protein
MRSKGYLIWPAAEHISWYPPIGGQPPTHPPAHQPGSWPWADAVSGLAEAANVKHIGASLPEGDLRSQLEASAARSIERILDHWCTRRSWPGPGPPPWVIAITAQLAAMATSHPAGTLRDELLRIAGQALLRPFGRRQA